MKRKTQSRTGRWSERTSPVELASPYVDAPVSPGREPRIPKAAGLGPYESRYDIALGYNQDPRIVVLP